MTRRTMLFEFPHKPVLPRKVEQTIVIPTRRPLAFALRSLFYHMNFLQSVSPYAGPFLIPECSLYLQGPIIPVINS